MRLGRSRHLHPKTCVLLLLPMLVGCATVAEHRKLERRVDGMQRGGIQQARAARTAAGSVVPPATTDAGSAAPAPEGGGGGASADEVRAYRGAWAAWSRGEAEVCIDQFREFLQTYASSTYAENASYWMADCYFKRGDYKTAILRFDDVVVRYPTGERAPDALYRTGEALLRLGPGYGKAAGKAFERVIDEYPSSGRVEEARKQLDLLGSGRAG
jgi:tol-pal system protein YbgF